MKQGFISLAKRHFAELLGVKESQIAELYDFVNTRFYIKISNRNDLNSDELPVYCASLYFLDETDKAVCVQVFGDEKLGGKGENFSEFDTSEAALQAACKYVNSVEFSPCGGKYPENILILFNSFFPVTVD